MEQKGSRNNGTENCKRAGRKSCCSASRIFQTDGLAAREEAEAFCEDYKAFLDKAKTEREAAAEIEKRLVAAGYRPFDHMEKTELKPGEKVYYNNRGKAILAATIGTRSLEEGAHFMIAHIDSPRLDLKPNPLYEDGGLSLFKTHYYGGIRKYQWSATPLSLHGVVYKRGGEKVEFCVGEARATLCSV